MGQVASVLLTRAFGGRFVGAIILGQIMLGTTATTPRRAPEYLPKIVTVLREGYGLDYFRADVMAGLTVAIVALPLSMAIAIEIGRAHV